MTTNTKTFTATTSAPVGFRAFRAEARRLCLLAGFPVRDERELIAAWLAGATARDFARAKLKSARHQQSQELSP